MNSNVEAAIRIGREVGVRVTAWGGDMVRINDAMVMSAHQAITGGWIRRAAR